MPRFKVKHEKKEWEIEARSLQEAYVMLLDKEGYIINQIGDSFVMYSQLEFPKDYLGYSKVYTIASDGCLLTSITSIYQFLTGKIITPPEMNKKLLDADCFKAGTALLDLAKVCETLGWDYKGAFRGIGEAPEDMGITTPTIKEVDYSIRPGKQQHFVVRMYSKSGNYILDPLGGVKRAINYYEKLVKDEQWKSKYFSYRVFKVK